MQIHELPTMSESPTEGVYAAVDDGTSAFKLDYATLAKAIIEEYTVMTAAGNNYGTKAAISLLASRISSQETQTSTNTANIASLSSTLSTLSTNREFSLITNYSFASGYALNNGGIYVNDNLVVIGISVKASVTTAASMTDIITGLPTAITNGTLAIGCQVYNNSTTCIACLRSSNKLTIRPQASISNGEYFLSGVYVRA